MKVPAAITSIPVADTTHSGSPCRITQVHKLTGSPATHFIMSSGSGRILQSAVCSLMHRGQRQERDKRRAGEETRSLAGTPCYPKRDGINREAQHERMYF